LTAIEGLEELENLEEVYVSHNGITHISGLDHNVSLQILANFSSVLWSAGIWGYDVY